ncbi:MAG TPA: ATP-binding protein, partial [Leptospiraceae bacterium]|nr:ATP-binding protein [Leptospiraceae bacterium]
MKSRRSFNTSGPNIPEMHYTLGRKNLIQKGIELVDNMRYFTIWAPRQTGKSTYFRLLANELENDGYRVCHINFENYKTSTENGLFKSLRLDMQKFWSIDLKSQTFIEFFDEIRSVDNRKLVLICDEIEGLNSEIFNQFLHTIRNLYHSRSDHSLKSVVLVGVSNITGIIQDNASPFNIADELDVPYFTDEETKELLGQHETETGQLFEEKVKQKISEITANQPGLVNGFARKLVEDHPEKKNIDLDDYMKVEEWYLTEAIDKNVSNIINKASKYRSFVESLLF